MFLFLVSAATVVPNAPDVRLAEEARVLEPLAQYDANGRRFVEFAPVVEVRAVSCVAIAQDAADCTYESRVRDFFDPDFGPWVPRQTRLVLRKKCWLPLPS